MKWKHQTSRFTLQNYVGNVEWTQKGFYHHAQQPVFLGVDTITFRLATTPSQFPLQKHRFGKCGVLLGLFSLRMIFIDWVWCNNFVFRISHWGQQMHICCSKIHNHQFRLWRVTCFMPNQYLNQMLAISFSEIFKLKATNFVRENEFEFFILFFSKHQPFCFCLNVLVSFIENSQSWHKSSPLYGNRILPGLAPKVHVFCQYLTDPILPVTDQKSGRTLIHNKLIIHNKHP